MSDTRECTCHPDDFPEPCAEQYALQECHETNAIRYLDIVIEKKNARIAELEAENDLIARAFQEANNRFRVRIAELEAVAEAVLKLPVDEMVERDNQGDPFLVGYCMQAQGEWDNVTQALRAAGYLK